MTRILADLREQFARFVLVPFPDDSENEGLSDLHAGIVEYDGYVAGLVSSVAGGVRVPLESLHPDHGLRRRAEGFSDDESLAVRATAGEYLAYLSRIDGLLLAARAATSPRQVKGA